MLTLHIIRLIRVVRIVVVVHGFSGGCSSRLNLFHGTGRHGIEHHGLTDQLYLVGVVVHRVPVPTIRGLRETVRNHITRLRICVRVEVAVERRWCWIVGWSE